MYRTIEMLCLMVLGRSRVISCDFASYRMFRSRVISGYSRDIGYIYIPVHKLLNLKWNEWRIETGRKMMRIYMYGSRTGFLGVLVPSVSVKDRTIVSPADHV